ncbi:hypothetical protein [Paenarthrobacter sp. NPDC057981]|uniref:hypothetical protein n=1 Tax=Paenarthrobacter sp. NPDC057981 TaxID=3346297 RepID=UPI0036D7CD85
MLLAATFINPASPASAAAALSAGMAVVGFSALTPAMLLQDATTVIDEMAELHGAIRTILLS